MKPKRKKILVEVTMIHIYRGISSPRWCPVALALMDAGLSQPFVSKTIVKWVGYDLQYHRAKMSRRAQEFVDDFDRGIGVKPSTFWITLL